MVQFLFRYGKTWRARSIPQSQGASRAGPDFKSKTKTTTRPACEKNCQSRGPRAEPLKRNGHAGASVSSSHEDRKNAVDQARVSGNTACRASNSPRNVRSRGHRVCNKSRLACDTPPWRTADRILQRRKPAPVVAEIGRSGGRNELVTIKLKIDRFRYNHHWTAQSCWLTNAPTVIKWKQRKFILLFSAF